MTVIEQTYADAVPQTLSSDRNKNALTYDRLLPVLENTSVHSTATVQITTQLKRMAVAMGVLTGRALGVHDFCYRLEPRGGQANRRLVMWVHSERGQALPVAELLIELTPEGYIFRLGEMLIRQSSPQPLATMQ